MSVFTQFTGGRKITSIVNSDSAGGTLSGVHLDLERGCKQVPGGVTAGVLATVLTLSGRGSLNFVSAWAVDTTLRTIRLVVTIDGTVIFDSTSSSTGVQGTGIVAVGASGVQASATIGVPHFQPIRFYSSCLVQIASSLTETNKVTCNLNYEVDQ